MTPIEEIMKPQRLLLLGKGYTESMLHSEGQPRRFLAILSTRLTELQARHSNAPTPVSVTQNLPADFENGRFPTLLEFNYMFHPKRDQLSLHSMKASLFDIEITYSVGGDPAVNLPVARQLLTDLKQKLLITLQKQKPGVRRPSRGTSTIRR